MMMRKISGKNQPTTPYKKQNGRKYQERQSRHIIWDIFSKFFHHQLQSTFSYFQKQHKETKLNFKSNNSEKYNQPFTPAELQETIKKSHNTTVGPDEIHYQFLKHLPKKSLDYLLTIFNDIWINSKVPES